MKFCRHYVDNRRSMRRAALQNIVSSARNRHIVRITSKASIVWRQKWRSLLHNRLLGAHRGGNGRATRFDIWAEIALLRNDAGIIERNAYGLSARLRHHVLPTSNF